jgi:hypothetical protein
MPQDHSVSEPEPGTEMGSAQMSEPPAPRYVQFRKGQVRERLRQAHRVVGEHDGMIMMRCGTRVDAWRVEDISQPLKPLEPNKALQGAPCVVCALKDMDAIAVSADSRKVDTSLAVTADDRRILSVLMRTAQWWLDDVAHHLPESRCCASELSGLADTLAELSRVIRDRIQPRSGARR